MGLRRLAAEQTLWNQPQDLELRLRGSSWLVRPRGRVRPVLCGQLSLRRYEIEAHAHCWRQLTRPSSLCGVRLRMNSEISRLFCWRTDLNSAALIAAMGLLGCLLKASVVVL